MSITDYDAEFRQLAEAEAKIRGRLEDPVLPVGRIGLLDQDLAEIRQVRFWLTAGGTGIRSTLVTTIEELVRRVNEHCHDAADTR